MIGDFLGDLTDDLEEFGATYYLEDFISGGPKTMHYLSFAARP
jgi:hypothetical protein